MDILDQYKLQFSGLNTGLHHLEYSITDAFFEATAFPDVQKGKLAVTVDLDKQVNMMVFQFHIEGEVELTCDRCLDPFTYPLVWDEQLIVKQVIEPTESDDDMLVYIDIKEHTFDFSHYLYEYINLALPMQHVHPQNDEGVSQCDPEMIKKIEALSKPIQNSQWDALKNLNLDKN